MAHFYQIYDHVYRFLAIFLLKVVKSEIVTAQKNPLLEFLVGSIQCNIGCTGGGQIRRDTLAPSFGSDDEIHLLPSPNPCPQAPLSSAFLC